MASANFSRKITDAYGDAAVVTGVSASYGHKVYLEVFEGGDRADLSLSPKKARRLAIALLKAADAAAKKVSS